MCRKAAEALIDDTIEVWGDGQQTRSFLYIDDCLEGVFRFMRQDTFQGPVNIGSEEMVTINELAQMALDVAGKSERNHVKNIEGQEFIDKYGFKCPTGVRGRNSDNTLFKEMIGWEPIQPLRVGIEKTFQWINEQIHG